MGFSKAHTHHVSPHVARVRALWRVWRPRQGLELQATFLRREGGLALCRVKVASRVEEHLWVDRVQEEVLGELRPLERLQVR